MFLYKRGLEIVVAKKVNAVQQQRKVRKEKTACRYFYYQTLVDCLARKDAGTSSSDNLFLSELREVLGLDNNRDVDLSVSEELENTGGVEVNDGGLSLGGSLGGLVNTLSGDVENLVHVGSVAELSVLKDVELAHTDLSEVTRMVLVHHDAVVVLTSSVTTSSGVRPVLSDTSVTSTDVSPLLPVLVGAGRHIGSGEGGGRKERKGWLE